MKIKATLLLIILLASCDGLIRFEVPQPVGRSNEKSIPKKFLGAYTSLTDGDSLVITENQILSYHEYNITSILDSADRIKYKTDTVFSGLEGNTSVTVTIINDSIFEHLNAIDTVFDFSRGDILRKFKGYYFVNHETSKNNWFVTKLGITKKGLVLGTISDSKELETLRELTNTKSDTVYNFNPTRKELKKILKNGGFKNEQRFVKIK